jgi:hypothetical protein
MEKVEKDNCGPIARDLVLEYKKSGTKKHTKGNFRNHSFEWTLVSIFIDTLLLLVGFYSTHILHCTIYCHR